MAFSAKTDYCGLATIFSSSLTLRDDAENASNETYQPNGQDGSFVATEVYGTDFAPTNSYGVKADIDADLGDVELNTVVTIDNNHYALESFTITTSAGAAPTLTATAQLIESGATSTGQCTYLVPAFEVSVKHHAQMLFNAASISSDGTLTDCQAVIGGTISKDKVAGVIISSDIGSGVITVSGTILQVTSTKPTLTPASGWVLTAPLSCTNPEAAYKSYTFELQKILTRTAPAPGA